MEERTVREQQKLASEQDENKDMEKIKQVKKEKKLKSDQSSIISAQTTQKEPMAHEKQPEGERKTKRGKNERQEPLLLAPPSSKQNDLDEEEKQELTASLKMKPQDKSDNAAKKIVTLLNRQSKFLDVVPDNDLGLTTTLQLRLSRVLDQNYLKFGRLS